MFTDREAKEHGKIGRAEQKMRGQQLYKLTCKAWSEAESSVWAHVCSCISVSSGRPSAVAAAVVGYRRFVGSWCLGGNRTSVVLQGRAGPVGQSSCRACRPMVMHGLSAGCMHRHVAGIWCELVRDASSWWACPLFSSVWVKRATAVGRLQPRGWHPPVGGHRP